MAGEINCTATAKTSCAADGARSSLACWLLVVDKTLLIALSPVRAFPDAYHWHAAVAGWNLVDPLRRRGRCATVGRGDE